MNVDDANAIKGFLQESDAHYDSKDALGAMECENDALWEFVSRCVRCSDAGVSGIAKTMLKWKDKHD